MLTKNLKSDNHETIKIENEVYINSPKLNIEKTFVSNYEKDKEKLKYTLDITNERKDSIAKKITLFEKITNGALDKNSIKVKDGNGNEISSENYDIVEVAGKVELKFKDDIYILGKNSNKQATLDKNDIPSTNTKVYDKITITYDVEKEKGKDSKSTTIVNSNDNTIDEDRK